MTEFDMRSPTSTPRFRGTNSMRIIGWYAICIHSCATDIASIGWFILFADVALTSLGMRWMVLPLLPIPFRNSQFAIPHDRSGLLHELYGLVRNGLLHDRNSLLILEVIVQPPPACRTLDLCTSFSTRFHSAWSPRNFCGLRSHNYTMCEPLSSLYWLQMQIVVGDRHGPRCSFGDHESNEKLTVCTGFHWSFG